jgi:hypothetical protein
MNSFGKMISEALFACGVLAACLGQALGRDAEVVPMAATAIGGYYTESLFGECIPATHCRLAFSAVPGSKSLLITLVTCDLQLSGSSVTLANVQLLAKGSGGAIISGRIQYLAPQFRASTAQYNHYLMTVPTSFLVLPGQRPLIEVDAFESGDIFLACSITGQRPSPF